MATTMDGWKRRDAMDSAMAKTAVGNGDRGELQGRGAGVVVVDVLGVRGKCCCSLNRDQIIDLGII